MMTVLKTVSRLRGLRPLCAASAPLVSPPPRHWRVSRVLAPPLRGLFSVCAALLAAALLSVPAYAGWWQTEYSFVGTVTETSGGVTQSRVWGDPDNPAISGFAYAGDYSPGSCQTSGTAKATLTWQPDDLTDTAPPKLWVMENASAWWVGRYGNFDAISGSRSVGLGGDTTRDEDNVENYDQMQGVLEKSYVHEVDSSSGTVVLTCALSASSSSSGAPFPADPDYPDEGGGGYSTELSACCSYGVVMIATPYDFKIAPGYGIPDNNNGILYFNYTWKSTTGNLSDLSAQGVVVYEHTVYGVTSQNPNGSSSDPYLPPNPPFDVPTGINNPTDYRIHPPYVDANGVTHSPVVCSGGWGRLPVDDTHSPGHLVAGVGSYTAVQDYRFYHPNPKIHGPIADGKYTVLDHDGQPHPIVRTVVHWASDVATGAAIYRYTITKQGSTASKIYQ